MRIQELSRQLMGKSHPEVREKIQGCTDDELVALIDGPSNRVADNAADLLAARESIAIVIDAIQMGRLRTALGRLRAVHILSAFGKKLPESQGVFLHLLNDRSSHVVDSALFGLVFMQNPDNIPAIRKAKADAATRGKPIEQFNLAIRALTSGNPFIYSPYFGVSKDRNVWQVTEVQLAEQPRLAEEHFKAWTRGKNKGDASHNPHN